MKEKKRQIVYLTTAIIVSLAAVISLVILLSKRTFIDEGQSTQTTVSAEDVVKNDMNETTSREESSTKVTDEQETSSKSDEGTDNENVQIGTGETYLQKLVTSKIYDDFYNGVITTDEYVRYNLYAQYDMDLLKDKYDGLYRSAESIHVMELVLKNLTELSEETVQYYLEHLTLSELTFEVDKENKVASKKIYKSNANVTPVNMVKGAYQTSSLNNSFVYSDESELTENEHLTTNLNEAVLSSDGHFVVWYTTKGINKISKEQAEKVAATLEATVRKYEEMYNCEYRFKATLIDNDNRFEQMKQCLSKSDIDEKYLESAMQVYLYEFCSGTQCGECEGCKNGGLCEYDNSPAQYCSGLEDKWSEIFSDFLDGDTKKSFATPYMCIRPSQLNGSSMEHLTNHELFHHFQAQVFIEPEEIDTYNDGNKMLMEATANWSSAMVSGQQRYSYLNECATTARITSRIVLTNGFAKLFGEGNEGYSFFCYLNAYYESVPNALEIFKKAMYDQYGLEYLNEQATAEQLIRAQYKLTGHYINQNWENTNFHIKPYWGITDFLYITLDEYASSINTWDYMSAVCSHIYEFIPQKGKEHIITLECTGTAGIWIYGKSDDRYIEVDSAQSIGEKITSTFDTSTFPYYHEYMIVIGNASLQSDVDYTLNIVYKENYEGELGENNTTDVNNGETETTSDSNMGVIPGEKDYIIVEEYGGIEDIVEDLWKYYFDSEGNVTHIVVSHIWKTEEQAESAYEEACSNDMYENPTRSNKKVTVTYRGEIARAMGCDTKQELIDGNYKFSYEIIDWGPKGRP